MGLYLMASITGRTTLPDFVKLYSGRGADMCFIALGHGTASGRLLDYFGLDSAEKAICFAVVSSKAWRGIKRDLEQRLHIDVPGVGVAFITPLSSIGGIRELELLTHGQDYTREEESEMKGTEYELIIAVSNQGFNEMVMDAARKAGARGGTIIHSRGTGMERAEQFLGISLAPEKDMTFIVTKTAHKNAIMRSIMEHAGMGTKARSIVFSLPVTDTAGLRLSDDGLEDDLDSTDAAEINENK